MRDEQAIDAIKAAICPQDLSNGIPGSGVNAVTVDHIAGELDAILADGSEHAWLNAEDTYGRRLWAMLVADFPVNLEGRTCPV